MVWCVAVGLFQVAGALSFSGLAALSFPGRRVQQQPEVVVMPELDVELEKRMQAAYKPAIANALMRPVMTGDIAVPEAVVVEAGALPEDMPRGVLLRNGPNSEEEGGGFLDGDGLIHSVALGDDGCWYSRAYIATDGRRKEATRDTKYESTLVHAPEGWPMLAALAKNVQNGLVPPQKDTANTAIASIGRDLYATMEQSRPARLSVDERGKVSTLVAKAALGKDPAWDPITGGSFAAHGRVCPDSGEYLAISYSGFSAPYAWLDVFDKAGAPVETRPIDLVEPVMIHDLAITENYAVVLDSSLVVRGSNVVFNKFPVEFDKTKQARLGLAPRKGGPTVWCDVDPYIVLHCVNAYEDGAGHVVLHAFKSREPSGAESFITHFSPAHLYEWVLDLRTGTCVSERWLNPDVPIEFPAIDPAAIGRKADRVFAMQAASYGGPVKWFKSPHQGAIFDSLVALSLDDGRVIDRYDLPPHNYLVSEPTFLPRIGRTASSDGYILLVTTRVPPSCEDDDDPKPLDSSVVILDAREGLREVARLRLPHAVPYGLHSAFVPF